MDALSHILHGPPNEGRTPNNKPLRKDVLIPPPDDFLWDNPHLTVVVVVEMGVVDPVALLEVLDLMTPNNEEERRKEEDVAVILAKLMTPSNSIPKDLNRLITAHLSLPMSMTLLPTRILGLPI